MIAVNGAAAGGGFERHLDRRQFVAALMEGIPTALVVSGLGSPSYDVFAAGARAENFHLWGAVGATAPLALGLALAQPTRAVVAITGDGDQLMAMGSLATIAAKHPSNLTVVVLDNGHFGETGMQRSHTSLGTDLLEVARACGIPEAIRVSEVSGAAEVAERIRARTATTFVHVLIESRETPKALPPRDGVANKNAFRAALGIPTF
jgi:thiamine pyrophosphate-dependent acetolactate synthase large subunit-like protein